MRLRPGLRWGSLQRSPRPLAGFNAAGRGGGREGEERGGEGREEKGRLTLMRSWNGAVDWLRPALSPAVS